MRKLLILGVAAATIAAGGAALAGDRGGHRWESLDADGDGEVTLSEMDARQQEMFTAADADGNGAISEEEMKAFHRGKRAGRHAKYLGDANGDGVVSRAEYDAHAASRFDKLDADGDGMLSDEEIANGRHHRRGHGRRGR